MERQDGRLWMNVLKREREERKADEKNRQRWLVFLESRGDSAANDRGMRRVLRERVAASRTTMRKRREMDGM